MHNAAKRPVVLPVEASLCGSWPREADRGLLPDRSIGCSPRCAGRRPPLDEALPLPMLILSRSPAIWLWQTLLYQVSHPDCLRNVHAAHADSPAQLIHRLKNAPRLERLPVKPP